MAKLFLTKLFVYLFACYTATQALQLGRCPHVRPKADFDVSGLLGTWYEHAKYPIPGSILTKCTKIEFDASGKGGDISVQVATTVKLTGVQIGLTGSAVVSGPGTLRMSADGIAGILANADISILGSDYSNYIVGFSCEEILGLGVFHNRYARILTREHKPDGITINNAKKALRDNGLSVRNLKLTEQLNCPH